MAYIAGYFSFGDFLKLFFLPSSSGAKQEILRRESELQLFKNPFYGSIADALSLIEQVIVCDQYHAGQYLHKDSIVIDAGANIRDIFCFRRQSRATRQGVRI